MLKEFGLRCFVFHDVLVYFVGLFYFVACSSDVILQQMEAKRTDLLRRIIAVDWALIC